jgi:hypothetical protein
MACLLQAGFGEQSKYEFGGPNEYFAAKSSS